MSIQYMLLPFEYLDETELLSDEEFGRLIRAGLMYAKDGAELSMEGNEKFFAARIKNMIDRNRDAYSEICLKRKKAAETRWDKKKNASGCNSMQMDASAYFAMQINANDANPNTNPKSNPKSKLYIKPSNEGSSEPAQPDTEPAVIVMPIVSGKYSIFQKDIDGWHESYPGVDILQQLRNMREWCLSNPTRQKTKNGVRRFITTWLAKEQDRAKAPARTNNKFNNFPQRQDTNVAADEAEFLTTHLRRKD